MNQAVIDGGRNPSYEGRFNEETPEMHLIRLAQARRIAALEGLLREVVEGYEWMRDNGYKVALLERIEAALGGP